MKPKKLFFLLFPVLLLFVILQSCRKDLWDSQDEVLQIEAKFFNHPLNIDPVVSSVINDLKRKNEANHFAGTLARKMGYPAWEKSFVERPALKKGLAARDGEEPEPVYVFTPVHWGYVDERKDFVDALFVTRITGHYFEYKMVSVNDYKRFLEVQNAGADAVEKAKKLNEMFMYFDAKVFGRLEYKYKDTLLLEEYEGTKLEEYVKYNGYESNADDEDPEACPSITMLLEGQWVRVKYCNGKITITLLTNQDPNTSGGGNGGGSEGGSDGGTDGGTTGGTPGGTEGGGYTGGTDGGTTSTSPGGGGDGYGGGTNGGSTPPTTGSTTTSGVPGSSGDGGVYTGGSTAGGGPYDPTSEDGSTVGTPWTSNPTTIFTNPNTTPPPTTLEGVDGFNPTVVPVRNSADTLRQGQIDSLLTDVSTSCSNQMDSLYNWGMANGFREQAFIVVRKNGVYYAKNFKPGSTGGIQANPVYTLSAGEELIAYGHTHAEDTASFSRTCFSSDDYMEFATNATKVGYFAILEVGNARYVLVVEDVSKKTAFNLSKKRNHTKLFKEKLDELFDDQNNQTSSQTKTEQAWVNYLGPSQLSGIGIYKSTTPNKNTFVKLN